MKTTLSAALVLVLAAVLSAREKKHPSQSLDAYLQRVHPQVSTASPSRTAGSLWIPGGALADISGDLRARRLNDPVLVRITEETFAQATGAVTTQRAYDANSAIAALPGQVRPAGINPLYNLNSAENLKGSGQASSQSRLRASLAGRVVAVLPNGSLVVEATKTVLMNNERQTVTLRGIARPLDIGSDNSLLSSRLSDLEIEVNGKGVISDSTRRPHWVLRLLTRVLSF